MLEKLFKLNQNNTTVRKELMAGFITFLTMAYILVVNPDILSATGMPKPALFTATALAAVAGTLCMAFIANLPIGIAPGMGINSFFAYTVVLAMGKTWQFALTAVFIEGLLFILLTVSNIREIIVNSIPKVLKDAIPVGIGLFIALVGLYNAGIVVKNENTAVSIGDMANPSVWIAFFGLLVTTVLLARRVNGAILIGILTSTLLALLLGTISMPAKLIAPPPSIEPIFAQFEWESIFTLDMVIIVFTFLFVDLFNTLGTLIGVISKAGLADENGNFPQMKKALFSDAISIVFASILGTSTTTAFVESATGVASGGRTGLTAVSIALFFGIALFFAPIFLIIPTAATAPALFIIGLFMITSIVKIDFEDITEGIPAFITIVFMPFTYSIAQGIIFGMLSYTLVKLFSARIKDISPAMYVLSLLFLAKIILDASKIMIK